jgi:ADP-ribosylglycohydrolase
VVVETLEAAADAPPGNFSRQEGWVLIALRNAFFRLLHASSLEEGVVATVMAGGDTDTNGAIAGALLGAVHGHDAIPARWRNAVLSCRPAREYKTPRVRSEEYWPIDALELAERLLSLSVASARRG